MNETSNLLGGASAGPERTGGVDLSDLEAKVDALITRCATLARRNRELRDRERSWRAERQELLERHQVAQAKIDSMLGRMDTSSENS